MITRLYLRAALVIGLVGAAAALVTRTELATELATPGLQVVSRGGYDSTVSLHAVLAMLAITVAFLALAFLVTPAPAVAARVTLAVIVVGAAVLAIGLLHGQSDYGWFAYTPLPDQDPAPPGAALARAGHVITGIGVAAACLLVVLATLRRLRAGRRLPFLPAALALSAGIIGVLTLVQLGGRPGATTTPAELALALPFAALLLDALLAGPGVARWWAVGGLVTVALGLAGWAATALTDSYTDVALDHAVVIAVMVFGLFAGLYRRWEKVFGTAVPEAPGRAQLAVFFAGYQLTFAAMAWLGHEGMPRRYADYLPQDGFTGGRRLATTGSVVIAFSLLPLVAALRRRP